MGITLLHGVRSSYSHNQCSLLLTIVRAILITLVSPILEFFKLPVSLSLRRVTRHRLILAMNNHVTNFFLYRVLMLPGPYRFVTYCQLHYGIELG